MTTTRRRFRRALALLVLATAVLLGGCGSDDASDSAPPLPHEALEAYFRAIASYAPELLATARESTEPGSNADDYAGYLHAFATAAIQGGTPIESSVVEPVDDGFTACGGTGDPASCVVWADIEVVDGLLVDFTIDGESLDDRLVAGEDRVETNEAASVSFLYAYKSVQSGTQFVVLQVDAVAALELDMLGATYTGPDGSDYPSAATWGPTSVAAGGSATVVVPFEEAPGSGTVSLPLLAASASAPVVVTIETAP